MAADPLLRQALLLSYLLASPEALALTRGIIEPEFFDASKDTVKIARLLLDHSSKYGMPPSLEMVRAETGLELISPTDAAGRLPWILDEVETFCRLQKTIQAVFAAHEKISAGDVGSIVEPIKQAVSLSLSKDLGVDYFSDPAKRLRAMLDRPSTKTGFPSFDYVNFGGLWPGSLMMVAGASGKGKSIWLTNFALNQIEMGVPTVYLSVEMPADQIAIRLDSMISGFSRRTILSSIDEAGDRVRLKARNCAPLWIKKFPMAGTTTGHLSAYLKDLELREGVRPGVVVMDYVDKLSPTTKVQADNIHLRDDYTTRELKDIASDYGMLMTATQMTKQSVGGANDDEEHHQGMLAGGKPKVDNSDFIFSIVFGEKQRQRNEYKVQYIKVRDGAPPIGPAYFPVDPETMRIRDRGPDAVERPREEPPKVAEQVDDPPAGNDRLNRLRELKDRFRKG